MIKHSYEGIKYLAHSELQDLSQNWISLGLSAWMVTSLIMLNKSDFIIIIQLYKRQYFYLKLNILYFSKKSSQMKQACFYQLLRNAKYWFELGLIWKIFILDKIQGTFISIIFIKNNGKDFIDYTSLLKIIDKFKAWSISNFDNDWFFKACASYS